VKAKLPGRALALGLILAQASGLVHVALAPHQICREHGELVESGPAGAEVDANSTAALHDGDGDGAQWSDPAHEHCAVAARHREQAPVSRGAQTLLMAAVSGSLSLEPGQPPPSRIAGWQVAPKQGPPAAS
jgi:hypothetical protein